MPSDIDRLLRNQHGVITRVQLRDSGATKRQIERLLAIGSFEPILHGVYRSAATLKSFDQRAMAAVLAGGADALVSHRMGIALCGMRNYRCDLMEISARHDVVRPEIVAHRYRSDIERASIRGIPVTTTARTLLDCATLTSEVVLGRFLETWLSTGRVKLAALEAEIDRSRMHPGASRIKAALANRMITAEEADSPAESLLGQLLVRHGLPAPELHHLVTVSTGVDYELDWSYPKSKVALEVDGYGIHLRSFTVFENDRLRRNELEIDGWRIMNFTKNLIVNRPARVIDQVRRMLAV